MHNSLGVHQSRVCVRGRNASVIVTCTVQMGAHSFIMHSLCAGVFLECYVGTQTTSARTRTDYIFFISIYDNAARARSLTQIAFPNYRRQPRHQITSDGLCWPSRSHCVCPRTIKCAANDEMTRACAMRARVGLADAGSQSHQLYTARICVIASGIREINTRHGQYSRTRPDGFSMRSMPLRNANLVFVCKRALFPSVGLPKPVCID